MLNLLSHTLTLGKFEDYESCRCPRGSNIVIDYVRISNTRTLLRCIRCKGTVGMLDDISTNAQGQVEKVRPDKRDWTMSEMAELR